MRSILETTGRGDVSSWMHVVACLPIAHSLAIQCYRGINAKIAGTHNHLVTLG